MTIASQSAYCRRLLYQVIAEKYDKKIIASGSKYGVKINKYSEVAHAKDNAFRQKRLETEIEEMIGFRKVIDLMVDAQKPIVGHNLFMDLCHIMKQFLIDDLPETLSEFLTELQPRFPRIYDTKYLFDTAYDFKSPNTHDSSLSALKKLVSGPDFSMPEISFDFEYGKYSGRGQTSAYHEAGYDSYVTGIVFIKLISKTASLNKVKDLTWEHLSTLESVKLHVNKIHLSRGARHSLDLGARL
ncbi:hypothetical protein DSO57_1008205 [Entomophthora muscae]|uniref:Uncharacterized protein n=1 Tax=Entomophthora muscae TaxID=34485 RepID=A0ACC2SWC2_9FUNG|nr:hypothetical protein DSO57_1008205 [Entomophthora muscae]